MLAEVLVAVDVLVMFIVQCNFPARDKTTILTHQNNLTLENCSHGINIVNLTFCLILFIKGMFTFN